MSLAIVRSRALVGMSAPEVAVEVHLGNGLPAFNVVGLAETEVRESRERVRAALLHLGFQFPQRRITVNLAPADLPKESGRFDLPIAVGVLCASDQLSAQALDRYEIVGELSLTGNLRPVRGAISMALAIRRAGARRVLLLPQANYAEAALIEGIALAGADGLVAVADQLRGIERPAPGAGTVATRRPPPSRVRHEAATAARRVFGADLADVRGNLPAQRALEIAAAGQHSLLFCGPPGGGKSMLAQRLPTILPPMTDEEAAEAAALASVAGPFDPADWAIRPYRAPHHSASGAALVGGGGNPRPGEISLAHRGVLFLDELPEFPRGVLEALREPLENGRITLSRALRHVDFPARFQLVAAMNPCPCGYAGLAGGHCRCTPDQIARYRGRLSGPLLDRIDLSVVVPPVPVDELLGSAPGESSAAVRRRVIAARAVQSVRQAVPNAELDAAGVATFCAATPPAARLLRSAVARLSLSSRATHRTLKVARTIADLANEAGIGPDHVAEALQFRQVGNAVPPPQSQPAVPRAA